MKNILVIKISFRFQEITESELNLYQRALSEKKFNLEKTAKIFCNTSEKVVGT